MATPINIPEPEPALKPRPQPAVRLFSSVRVFGGHIRGVFLNTWVGRGKSREDVRHTHGCARCEYVARTPRLGVSGYIYFNMNISFGGGK